MIDATQLLLAFLVGLVLGGCYFGGLWLTVRRLPDQARIWQIYFGSLLIRLLVFLSCFYLLLNHFGWEAGVVCLLGFVVSRSVLIQILRRAPAVSSSEGGQR